MASGGGNRLQLHEITPGSPDTIVSATPTIVMNQTISSAWDKMLHLGAQITLDQDKYDDVLIDFLIDAVPVTVPADATTAEKYEDGVDSDQGTSTAGYTGNRYVFGWYGGVNPAGTKRHFRVGVGYIAQESGAFTTSYGTPTKPSFILKGMKQTASNSIVIASTFYSGTLVDTVAPSPALPTSVAGGTYGTEIWLKTP